jgi:hypothetical protein
MANEYDSLSTNVVKQLSSWSDDVAAVIAALVKKDRQLIILDVMAKVNALDAEAADAVDKSSIASP